MQVFKSPKESLGDLGALPAADLIAAATDVAVIVDGQGFIRDVAFNKEELSLELDAQGRWMGSKLAEIVTPETRAKVAELLQDAATPKALAEAVISWLDAADRDPARLLALHAKFDAMHHALQRDTATIATDAIQKILQN